MASQRPLEPLALRRDRAAPRRPRPHRRTATRPVGRRGRGAPLRPWRDASRRRAAAAASARARAMIRSASAIRAATDPCVAAREGRSICSAATIACSSPASAVAAARAPAASVGVGVGELPRSRPRLGRARSRAGRAPPPRPRPPAPPPRSVASSSSASATDCAGGAGCGIRERLLRVTQRGGCRGVRGDRGILRRLGRGDELVGDRDRRPRGVGAGMLARAADRARLPRRQQLGELAGMIAEPPLAQPVEFGGRARERPPGGRDARLRLVTASRQDSASRAAVEPVAGLGDPRRRLGPGVRSHCGLGDAGAQARRPAPAARLAAHRARASSASAAASSVDGAGALARSASSPCSAASATFHAPTSPASRSAR